MCSRPFSRWPEHASPSPACSRWRRRSRRAPRFLEAAATAPPRSKTMSDLIWREVLPPKNLSLAAATGLVRALAGRPRFGLAQVQPVVLFELWLSKESVRWLVGYEERLGRHFAGD